MKKIYLIATLVLFLGAVGCTKKDLADAYPDPSKITSTTLENQFAGFVTSNFDYVMYHYWNYFVVLQGTALHYTQAVGWQNAPGQYVPGAAAISSRWNNFYNFVGQYKDFLNVYSKLSSAEQESKKMYLIAANIYFYDQSQTMVDLFGDIPWSKAGMMSTNGGNYMASYAPYDGAVEIYTKMLDDLKGYSDALNSITVSDAVAASLRSQDVIFKGDVSAWKKYCNSLRLRMLTRVSNESSLSSRAASEIASIVGDPGTYPLITSNSDNAVVNVHDINTAINSNDFYGGIIGWGYNDQANQTMIDSMNHNADPRLRFMFQPGSNAEGVYIGMNTLLDGTTQQGLQTGGTISTYNYSAITKNPYLPGMLINAAEVNFLLAEYYLKAGNDASAQASYENGIRASIEYYAGLNSLNVTGTHADIASVETSEVDNYLASNIAWANATSDNEKMNIIAVQKWINYSILQPLESWAEVRRTKLPAFTFASDNTNALTQPPSRFIYPSDEATYNGENYSKVQSKDNLTTKLFWDVK